KKHPLGEKRNHPGSKLRQGFWMVFRFGVNNWGYGKATLTWLEEIFKEYNIIKANKTTFLTLRRLACSLFSHL
ncbi:hypothetical protein, partial [Streptococcus pneumoniae]|uniref:hypothetical protein n=1 Tax=Streptococcus pneumoniae TaxID=1313 RepID=UPI001CE1D649